MAKKEGQTVNICCGSVVCDHRGNKHVVLDIDTGENTIGTMQIFKRKNVTEFGLSGGMPISGIRSLERRFYKRKEMEEIMGRNQAFASLPEERLAQFLNGFQAKGSRQITIYRR